MHDVENLLADAAKIREFQNEVLSFFETSLALILKDVKQEEQKDVLKMLETLVLGVSKISFQNGELHALGKLRGKPNV